MSLFPNVYFAKFQVDRAQRAIDHCSHDIAQMDLKLSNPYASEFEKNKIREMRDFHHRNLEAAQAELGRRAGQIQVSE